MKDLKINQIGQISIPVMDLEKSINFYKDVLNLTFLFQANKLAFFDSKGVRILLDQVTNESDIIRCSIFYFSVDDIFESVEHIKKHHVEVVDEPHVIAKMNDIEVWMAFFKDPDDHIMAFMSEIKVI